MKLTAMNKGAPSPTTVCTKAQVVDGSCTSSPPLNWDNGAYVKPQLVLPPATTTTAFAGAGTPEKFMVAICYSEPMLVKRKWRSFKPIFAVRT
jgi:hypothetical protein